MTFRARYTGHSPHPLAIARVFRDPTGPVGRDLDARTKRVLASARRKVGVQSGTLLLTLRRGPHSVNATGAYRDVIGGKRGLTEYHGYHLFGTPPHIIRPRRRTALRFIVGGRLVFATRVRHPGTKPNPYLQRALRAAR